MAKNYIELADGRQLPPISTGGGASEIATAVTGGRNTSNVFIGQPVGDDKIRFNPKWNVLTGEEMTYLLSLFDKDRKGKFIQDFRVFDPRANDFVVMTLYVGNRKQEIYHTDENGIPTRYVNVSFPLIEA